MKKHIIILTIFTLVSFSPIGRAAVNQVATPKTASYFLLSGTTLEQPEIVQALAKHDLIIIPAEAQEYNQPFFRAIRTLNPKIIILAYVPTVSWNHRFWKDPLHDTQRRGVREEFWLTNAQGEQRSVWPDTSALNLYSNWSLELARFTDEYVLASGLWDGIFFDEFFDSIDWVGDLDLDRDGQNDPADLVNKRLETGYTTLLSQTRERVGKNPIIIINGSSNPTFAPYINGRMFETFPSSQESTTYWSKQTNAYLTQTKISQPPQTVVINVNTKNTGIKNNYKDVRFGLATTLLGDGYFSYDFGDQNHSQLWHYDEYNAVLGEPKGEVKNQLLSTQTEIHSSVWGRDYAQGKVLLNATARAQTISLDGEYEKLHGIQDPLINDGSIVSSVTLGAKDGLLLLRPIEELLEARFTNGSFVRIFGQNGQTKRTGFFSYEADILGSTQVINTTNYARRERLTADKTFVRLYSENGLISQFAPFGTSYRGGISFAYTDLDQDGQKELVIGQQTGGSRVLVTDVRGRKIVGPFSTFHPSFTGGVHVAAGDIDGDGFSELIVGAGNGGGPHVRIFNHEGVLIHPGFFAYRPEFRGGVHVAAGDLDGDGRDEIITGAGIGGGPHVRVWNAKTQLIQQYFAFDPSGTQGVDVSAADLDGDGLDEVIGLSTSVFTFSFE